MNEKKKKSVFFFFFWNWACTIKNALNYSRSYKFHECFKLSVKQNTNIFVNNGAPLDKPRWQTVQTLLWGTECTHIYVGTFLSWFHSPLIDLPSLAWLSAHDEKNGGSPCSCDLRAHHLLPGVWLGEDSLAAFMINGVDFSSTTATETASWVSNGLEIIYTVRGHIKKWQPIRIKCWFKNQCSLGGSCPGIQCWGVAYYK